MPIVNNNKNTVLAEQALIADTFYYRSKGLLGKRDFTRGQALIINGCNSIHTFFMRFAIDVLFLDKDNKVVGLKSNIKPWRISRIYWKAKLALELPAGVIVESNTQIGDEISWG